MKKIVDDKGLDKIRQDIEENYSAPYAKIRSKEMLYWGLSEHSLDQKDIEALQQGKTIVLSVRDEYLVSINLPGINSDII
jgi:hypothetical protein